MEKIIILCAVFLMAVFFFKWKHRDSHTHRDGAYHHKHRIGHKHGEGFSIDFYAYTSKIRHWNPTFKVSLSVSSIFAFIN